METNEEPVTVVELLLREPEIVAWLEDLLPAEAEADHDEPPRAA
jgi:hypothetical protein